MKEERIVRDKPPIGITTRHYEGLLRLSDLRGAIRRYYNAGMKIPVEWIEEYNYLIDLTKK